MLKFYPISTVTYMKLRLIKRIIFMQLPSLGGCPKWVRSSLLQIQSHGNYLRTFKLNIAYQKYVYYGNTFRSFSHYSQNYSLVF